MRTVSVLLLFFFGLFMVPLASAQVCVDCHQKATPNVVTDWQLSKHSKGGIDCAGRHGDAHKTATDFHQAKIPAPETCGQCHEERVKQLKSGKHTAAWAAMKAMPTMHYQPMPLTEGMKGCGGCHKIGVKSAADVKEMRKAGLRGFGMASCDACHTRHTFSVQETRQPQA